MSTFPAFAAAIIAAEGTAEGGMATPAVGGCVCAKEREVTWFFFVSSKFLNLRGLGSSSLAQLGSRCFLLERVETQLFTALAQCLPPSQPAVCQCQCA
jgi:hypothetical protein